MCGVCGCGGTGPLIGGKPARRRPVSDRGATQGWRPVASGPGHAAAMPAERPERTANRPAGADERTRMLRIEQDILGKNDRIAAHNRQWLAQRRILALNLVSSPGSGKTTLLVRTLQTLAGRVPVAVIEGDQQTEFDAERIRATGVPALQINTGKGCHLDADMVAQAFVQLPLADDSLLLIENVGNLVCPAAFDLGEAHKVVILSVTEGEDKPLKYPDMFAAADLMILNKIDLLPYLSFDVARAIDYAHRVRPGLPVVQLSATTGEGMEDWLAWLDAARQGGGGPEHPHGHGHATTGPRDA